MIKNLRIIQYSEPLNNCFFLFFMIKNLIQKISLVLVVIGIFIIILQPFQPITGAVIDLSTNYSKINFLFGAVLIVAGIFIHLFDRKK